MSEAMSMSNNTTATMSNTATSTATVEKRLLTKPEAMAYLALRSGATFDRMVRRHRVPRVEITRRTIRYRVADLEKLIRQRMEVA